VFFPNSSGRNSLDPPFHLKHISAAVAILAVSAAGADGCGFGKRLELDHVVNGLECGTGFGQKRIGHGKPECRVVRYDEDKAGGNIAALVATGIVESSIVVFLPGPGWLYGAAAVVYDVNLVAQSVAACQ